MSDETPEPRADAPSQLPDGWDVWDPGLEGGDERLSLVELINRVLDRGVVIHGDIMLSVAGVDLVYLGLSAVLTSVATAHETLGRRVGRESESGGEG